MFNDFEGFKRIKNTVNLTIDGIYEVLEAYQKEMGEMKFLTNLGVKKILVKLSGKYDAEIKISGKHIIIERILEEGKEKDNEPSAEEGKQIEMAQADRMIDQISDLLQDYIKNGRVSEHITASKRTLVMEEKEKKNLGGLLPASKMFVIKDVNNNPVYEVTDKKINKVYSVKNLSNKMEVVSVSYEKIDNDILTIQEKPFRITEMKLDTTSVKTRFISLGNDREIKISADYTDNHYTVELKEIVIGAFDCLDPKIKKEYRIEVNDISNINLVISAAVLIDEYLEKTMLNNK